MSPNLPYSQIFNQINQFESETILKQAFPSSFSVMSDFDCILDTRVHFFSVKVGAEKSVLSEDWRQN